ncbi:hypothetical protein IU443_10355 [Nocardia farcinica]|uniref:hypothetical protein n=1 Tax=Nocardia farcinica TaxID=37329 RepID=UPI000A3AD93F|nr:hypothetical protein [Nocardia farcinica]MBC9818386.1 hypothetical protein [Nocardia farcinica]MBF6261956.1 hypothetical protein [Nocardia farcinica]MBF6280496.1 hypothetical protein [Nocardia farcinica]MBF6305047.1 hypothetical protein [Nocardia farcinica]MBF6390347.1 hypothetical protein [Nocardia farcinica]
MFTIAALVPSPPVLVPELCGGQPGLSGDERAEHLARLRTATLAAVGELSGVRDWTVIGVDEADLKAGSDTAGTFRGFGADVRAGLSARALAGEPDPRLPLPLLIAGWLRGIAAPAASADALLVAADTPPPRCRELGAQLRADLDAAPGPRGVLVVADGACTLSTSAPGYWHEDAPALQQRLDDALDAGDRAGLADLDAARCARVGLAGRAAYQVLAGLFAPDAADPAVRTYYRDAPFGVGYHVSVWRPGEYREGRAG